MKFLAERSVLWEVGCAKDLLFFHITIEVGRHEDSLAKKISASLDRVEDNGILLTLMSTPPSLRDYFPPHSFNRQLGKEARRRATERDEHITHSGAA